MTVSFSAAHFYGPRVSPRFGSTVSASDFRQACNEALALIADANLNKGNVNQILEIKDPTGSLIWDETTERYQKGAISEEDVAFFIKLSSGATVSFRPHLGLDNRRGYVIKSTPPSGEEREVQGESGMLEMADFGKLIRVLQDHKKAIERLL